MTGHARPCRAAGHGVIIRRGFGALVVHCPRCRWADHAETMTEALEDASEHLDGTRPAMVTAEWSWQRDVRELAAL